MSIYQYKAVNNFGKTVKGKLPAQNELELESKLKQSNLDLISAKKVSVASSFTLFSQVDLKEMELICIHFYHLERAGVPMLEAIGDLRDSSENEMVREVMMDVYDSLKNGKSFSSALAQHGYVFDKIFVGLVLAGEKTGSFVEVFQHLQNHYKWLSELKKKIKKATYYPFFVLLVMIGVIAMMMVFVIPKLTNFLLVQKIQLPFYTVLLIAISNYVANFWKWFIFLPIAIYFTAKISSKFSKAASYYLDLFKLNLPILGNILRKIEIARFCHFFAITYKSGIPILDCLEISSQVVLNNVIREAILIVREDVAQGRKLNEAVTATKQFPKMVLRMFKVGEDSGNLDQALENINVFYDAEINTSIDNLVGIIQPALTILMGGLMLWITIAVFGPIYAHFGDVGKGR